VDGIGAKGMLEEMWPLASRLLDGSCVVSLAETAAAVKLLVERNRVVAEGAGATSVAAALAGKAGAKTIVCVVSAATSMPRSSWPSSRARCLSGPLPPPA